MTNIVPNDHPSLRLLEGWLPLAQALSDELGWGDGAPALEALVRAAAPALGAATDLAAARAILMLYHAVLHMRSPQP